MNSMSHSIGCLKRYVGTRIKINRTFYATREVPREPIHINTLKDKFYMMYGTSSTEGCPAYAWSSNPQ